jgi:hypothetical protein
MPLSKPYLLFLGVALIERPVRRGYDTGTMQLPPVDLWG